MQRHLLSPWEEAASPRSLALTQTSPSGMKHSKGFLRCPRPQIPLPGLSRRLPEDTKFPSLTGSDHIALWLRNISWLPIAPGFHAPSA